MFLVILFYFLTSFIATSFQTNQLVNILKQKNNLFYTLNENVHNALNSMFKMLKLKSDFLKSSKIRLLLIMHSDLTNIAVKNFNIYKDIMNISQAENSINISEFTKIIDQIVEEYSIEKINHLIETTENITVESESMESLSFLEDFLQKINALTVDNFTIKSNDTFGYETDIRKPEKKNTNKLKLWIPPTHSEKEELFNNLTNRRIYMGKKTRIKKYPFMASIHVMNEFMCAGSIISNDLVITAASCLQIVFNNKQLRESPYSIFIRVGSDFTKRFGETIPIRELHFHPQYEPFSLKNNLALLRMGKELKSLNKKRKIRRIKFDKEATRLQDVEEVTILGWGATDNVFQAKTYQPLAVDDIDVYDFEKCQEIYSTNYVSDTNFCLGFESKGGGACNKDVGGPGVVNGVLMGVISFGPPVCGAPDMPTVLVKVGFYADWIESVMHKKSSGEKLTELRTAAELTTDEFPATIDNEIDELYLQNPNSARTEMKQDYPEEVAILNQILNDVILSNKSVVDDILYGALEDDFSDFFKSSTRMTLHHHPLVNKSVFLIPDVHDFGKEHQEVINMTTSSPRSTTTHPGLNVNYMDDDEERHRYLQAAYHLMTVLPSPKTRTASTTEEPFHITDRYGRTRNRTILGLDTESEYSKEVSSENSEHVSDNYEGGSESEYESKGLSIDVDFMRQGKEVVTETTTLGSVVFATLKHRQPSKDNNIRYSNPKLEVVESKNILKKPYTSRIRKATRVILKKSKKIYANDDEHFRSKMKKRKNKKLV